jgi:hypothetical protein
MQFSGLMLADLQEIRSWRWVHIDALFYIPASKDNNTMYGGAPELLLLRVGLFYCYKVIPESQT